MQEIEIRKPNISPLFLNPILFSLFVIIEMTSHTRDIEFISS